MKFEPVFLIDSREQAPYTFEGAAKEITALPEGDYGLRGFAGRDGELFGIAIERKALADFITCCTFERERFEKELRRLRCYQYAAVIVEANLGEILAARYRSEVLPASVLASIAAWATRYGIGGVPLARLWAPEKTEEK